jgi:ABC-type nitrate/sulfonate/bicarbonate transport system substrate-binding protein
LRERQTAQWVERNAALAKGVAAALHATAQYINRNPAEASAMLATYTKIAPPVVAQFPRLRFAETNDPALVQPVVDLLAKYGFIDRRFAATELFAR